MRRTTVHGSGWLTGIIVIAGAAWCSSQAQPADGDATNVPKRGTSSYSPVDITESFATIKERMSKAKPEIMKRQLDLLGQRYDLSDKPAKDVTFSDRDKHIQE